MNLVKNIINFAYQLMLCLCLFIMKFFNYNTRETCRVNTRTTLS